MKNEAVSNTEFSLDMIGITVDKYNEKLGFINANEEYPEYCYEYRRMKHLIELQWQTIIQEK